MTVQNTKVNRIGHHQHRRNGTITIVSHMSGTGTGCTIDYGVSYCSKKDQYNKKHGVVLATERSTSAVDFTHGIYSGTVFAYHRTSNAVLVAILCDILSRNDLPSWARPLVMVRLAEVLVGEIIDATGSDNF